MDKMEASLLGIGAFAATQILHGLRNKDISHMRDLMRTEVMDIETISGNTKGSNESIVPGIALNEFVSNKYKISFKYPKNWSRNPRYEDKYEGENGFFEIGDFTGMGENIDEAVKAEVNEAYKPYGNNPTIRKFIVDGQPARVIYPSGDQAQFYKDRETAIVVEYPQPIVIDGKKYDYVVIWANREFVPLIISTFKFVK